MGLELVTRRFAKKLSDVFTSSGTRWSDAAAGFADGTYDAAQVQTDVNDSMAELWGLWATLLAPWPTPVLPMAFAKMDAAKVQASPPKAMAVLEKPIGAAAVLSVTGLVLLTDSTKSLTAQVGPQGALNDEILVSVDKPLAAPTAGSYHGVVAADGEIVALVLIVLT
jgi:hypothetical protein